MSSGRVIVRACWGGTCAMDGWNRRGRCLVAPRIDVDRGAKRRGRPPVMAVSYTHLTLPTTPYV